MNKAVCDNYVLAIKKYGSFTMAAKELAISQPAITQAVNALEKELGIRIFNRKTSPVSETREGSLYIEHIERVRALETEFRKQVDCIKADGERKVIAGAPAVYTDSILCPAAAKLSLAHPEYSIRLATGSLEKLMDLHEHGELDCFIATSDALPDEFSLIPVLKEEIVMCVPEESALHEKLARGITADALAGENFIFLKDSLPLQQRVNAYLSEMGIRPRAGIEVDQVATALRLTELGAGISFASRNEADGHKVRTYTLGLEGRNIYIAMLKDHYQTTALRDLILMIRDIGKDTI